MRVQRSAISVGTESYVIRTFASAEKPLIIGYSPVACVEAAGQQAAQYFLKGDRVVYFVADRSEEGLPHVNGGHQSPALLSVNPQYRDLLGPD